MPAVVLWLQDVADITAALEGELEEMRRDKKDMGEQYLSQIAAAAAGAASPITDLRLAQCQCCHNL